MLFCVNKFPLVQSVSLVTFASYCIQCLMLHLLRINPENHPTKRRNFRCQADYVYAISKVPSRELLNLHHIVCVRPSSYLPNCIAFPIERCYTNITFLQLPLRRSQSSVLQHILCIHLVDLKANEPGPNWHIHIGIHVEYFPGVSGFQQTWSFSWRSTTLNVNTCVHFGFELLLD